MFDFFQLLRRSDWKGTWLGKLARENSCLDNHHFKLDELETVGELSKVCFIRDVLNDNVK